MSTQDAAPPVLPDLIAEAVAEALAPPRPWSLALPLRYLPSAPGGPDPWRDYLGGDRTSAPVPTPDEAAWRDYALGR